MHFFDTAIALTPAGDDRFRGATSPAYANMVGPFGGTTGAVLLNAALQHPARLGEPIALTVNFASAIADGAFEIEARAVRTNRSTQHWTMLLTQGDEVAATATAVFAQRRETWSAPEAVMPADLPRPETLARLDRALLPWIERYDMRFIRGGMPAEFDAQEQPDSSSVMWVRDEPPRPLDFASLAAICDSFFPRIFVRRRQSVPIGTVSLTTYFHADAAMLAAQAERPVLGSARALNFRNGYFDQSAEVWSDAGALLASTHQIVYFRA
ncbi:MAG TPA: thioesterase family protein [Burkholderiaceae bacterium]|jgi:acyl-CoA thioesterase